MRSSFLLDRYEVVSCSYVRNDVDREYQGSVKFLPAVQRAEEASDKFRVEVKTLVTGLADIELVIAGYFTSTSLPDDDIAEESVLFASMHLLLPFIRSFIHTVSCQDGRAAVTIPVINVADLLASPTLVHEDDSGDHVS